MFVSPPVVLRARSRSPHLPARFDAVRLPATAIGEAKMYRGGLFFTFLMLIQTQL
jgi:hypothetical protein